MQGERLLLDEPSRSELKWEGSRQSRAYQDAVLGSFSLKFTFHHVAILLTGTLSEAWSDMIGQYVDFHVEDDAGTADTFL